MTLLEAAQHEVLTKPCPALEAIKTAGRWIADLVVRACRLIVKSPTHGYVPSLHRPEPGAIRRQMLQPTEHKTFIGKEVAELTVRAMSVIAGGKNPMEVATEAIRAFPDGLGLQIAEDALKAWMRSDRRAELRYAA